jgi:hypothetical protein
MKEICYFLIYCLFHTKSSEKSKGTVLTLFRALYRKIKYCEFLLDDDYEVVFECLRKQSKKLTPEFKEERICLNDCYAQELSEYYAIEKIGIESSYDARVGNRYTRRTYVKEIYNEYYGTYSSKKFEKISDENGLIRSQDHIDGKFDCLILK